MSSGVEDRRDLASGGSFPHAFDSPIDRDVIIHPSLEFTRPDFRRTRARNSIRDGLLIPVCAQIEAGQLFECAVALSENASVALSDLRFPAGFNVLIHSTWRDFGNRACSFGDKRATSAFP